jgi:transcriptional regulator with XRE-family HTH domain
MKSWKDFEKIVQSVNSQEEFKKLKNSSFFASELINARLKRNLTQAELAKLCGMKQSAIARIENGTLPRIDTVFRIAEALDTEISFFNSPVIDTNNQVVSNLEDRIAKLEMQILELTEKIAELVKETKSRNQVNITINKSEHLYNNYPLNETTKDSVIPLHDYPQRKPMQRENVFKGGLLSGSKI